LTKKLNLTREGGEEGKSQEEKRRGEVDIPP